MKIDIMAKERTFFFGTETPILLEERVGTFT
jgi:hypothetical protein